LGSDSLGDVWSYSRFNTFISCPFAFRRKYIDHIKLPSETFFVIGTVVDKAFRLINMGEPVNLQIIWEEVMKETEQKNPGFPLPYFTPGDKAKNIEMAAKFVEVYLKNMKNGTIPIADREPVLIQPKQIPGTEHFMQFFPDATCSNLNRVLEYKTAGMAWSEDQFFEHEQPDIYAWGWGTRPSQQTLVFNKRVKDESKILQSVIREFSDERVIWIIKRIALGMRLYELLKSTDIWLPFRSWKCKSYHFSHECRQCSWAQEYSYVEEKVPVKNFDEEFSNMSVVPPKTVPTNEITVSMPCPVCTKTMRLHNGDRMDKCQECIDKPSGKRAMVGGQWK